MTITKRLFHTLAVLSLFMHVTAHLSPVLAELNDNFQITICSADTIRTISIDENGNEIPAPPTMRMHDCAFCAATDFTATKTQNRAIYPAHSNHLAYKEPGKFFHTVPAWNDDHPARAPPQQS